MRVIVTGSRSIKDPDVVRLAISHSRLPITELVCGMAPGPDLFAADWAQGAGIPVTTFPAEWGTYGRGAGMIRNQSMAEYVSQDPEGGGLVAVWDGVSRGTADMIRRAHKLGLKIYVHRVGSA